MQMTTLQMLSSAGSPTIVTHSSQVHTNAFVKTSYGIIMEIRDIAAWISTQEVYLHMRTESYRGCNEVTSGPVKTVIQR